MLWNFKPHKKQNLGITEHLKQEVTFNNYRYNFIFLIHIIIHMITDNILKRKQEKHKLLLIALQKYNQQNIII